ALPADQRARTNVSGAVLFPEQLRVRRPCRAAARGDLRGRAAAVRVLRELDEGLQRYRPAERRDRPEPPDRRDPAPRLLLQQARARRPRTTRPGGVGDQELTQR